ncbi:Isochorismatase hydrolase [Astrocystis sublimbata]|nr:Isochorismatase hydrolase [Astrocystis sublimbata]
MSYSRLHEPSAYRPSQTALMFLDYQNLLVDMMPSHAKERLITAAKALLEAARKNNIAILHCTCDTNTVPPATNKVAATWDAQYKPIFSASPELGAEYVAFAPTAHSTSLETVHKRPPELQSVLDDKLVPYLRDELGVAHLIFAGIATSGAIMGTMSHGTDIGFVVSVVADACWDPNAQVHTDLIETVIPSLAWVSSVEQAVGYMSG